MSGVPITPDSAPHLPPPPVFSAFSSSVRILSSPFSPFAATSCESQEWRALLEFRFALAAPCYFLRAPDAAHLVRRHTGGSFRRLGRVGAGRSQAMVPADAWNMA
jgi:hypothetical protein